MASIDKEVIIERIVDNLRKVYDPEIPVNIYDLGMIYSIDWNKESREGTILMTFTSPACPVADQVVAEVETAALKIEEVRRVQVDITFDPPWDKSMMAEEAQLELGWI